MNILIANVGNARTNEIKVLAQALNKKHNVTIACMGTDSGYRGQAFSFADEPVRVSPLLYKEVVKNANWVADNPVSAYTASLSKPTKQQGKIAAFDNIAAYEFFSNPADAISIMLGEIMLHETPDMVICGINNGVHMGRDIYTSSNLGMAMEAAFFKVPTIAIGVEWQPGGHREEQLQNAVTFLEKNIEKLYALKLPSHTFLSINVPQADTYKALKGVKITRMSIYTRGPAFEEMTDTKGNKYFWPKPQPPVIADDDVTSTRALFGKGYITITPLKYDATDYDAVRQWQSGADEFDSEVSE